MESYETTGQTHFKNNIKNHYTSIKDYKCTHCQSNIVKASLNRDAKLPLCYNHFIDTYYEPKKFEGELQASTVTSTETSGGQDSGESKEQVFQFMDENVGGQVGEPATSYSIDGQAADQDLADFLARPVRVATFNLSSSDVVGASYSYDIWHNFLSDPAVTRKLYNFAYLRGDLKIKFVVNASQFVYGALLASYQPLPYLSPRVVHTGSGTNWLMESSQRPHLWLYPQNSEGGEMTLPFFYNKNWVRITSAPEVRGLGKLTVINVSPIQSANGVSSEAITVQVYAYMDNVKLSGPTLGVPLQSKDEYKVSHTASALGTLAGSLKGIPAISPFATATETGFNMLAKGLAAMGFSNPPMIQDQPAYRPTAFPPLASTEISYPVDKLTVDPKNELSIDPGMIGLDSKDELEIKSLVTRESFLGQGSWSTADAVDKLLFSSIVHPVLWSYDTLSNVVGTALHLTPAAWTSLLFKNWRGDLIFRFKFVCSPFHKGRVRIAFDPQGNSGGNVITTANTANTVYTALVDLGKDNDVEFRVPYLQAFPFLEVMRTDLNGAAWQVSPYSFGANTFNHREGYDNGYITLRVATELTAPVGTSSVPILVSVRAADNFELANPGCEPVYQNKFSYFPIQSKDVYQTEESNMVTLGKVSPAPAHRYLLNFGENVISLRQLLRRSTFVEGRQFPTPYNSNQIYAFGETVARIPWPYGYNPIGIDSVSALVGVGSKPFTYSKMTPLTWVMGAFVGVRGSVNWTINADANGVAIGNFTIQRDPSDTANPKYNQYDATSTANGTGFAAANYLYNRDGSAGMTVTNQLTQAGSSIQVPMYSKYTFESADYTRASGYGTYDDANKTQFSYNMMLIGSAAASQPTLPTANIRVYKYAAIGSDFNLHFFLNTPTVYIYNSGGL